MSEMRAIRTRRRKEEERKRGEEEVATKAATVRILQGWPRRHLRFGKAHFKITLLKFVAQDCEYHLGNFFHNHAQACDKLLHVLIKCNVVLRSDELTRRQLAGLEGSKINAHGSGGNRRVFPELEFNPKWQRRPTCQFFPRRTSGARRLVVTTRHASAASQPVPLVNFKAVAQTSKGYF